MTGRLVIPCADRPSDILVLEYYSGDLNVIRLEIANEDDVATDDSNSRMVCMDDARARLLFNTLGVWLVRKGPGATQ